MKYIFDKLEANTLRTASVAHSFNTGGDREMQYGDGTNSSIGEQFNTFKWDKQSIIETAPERYFSQLSDVMNMPKHFGKKIKLYHYIPLLSDDNLNDQGIDATGAKIVDGNVYGSSKDIGTIVGKLPVLSEHGGQVNGVGYTRTTIEGSMANFGFHDTYTTESLDFDTDENLQKNIRREAIRGASQMVEAQIQIDLLNGAGVISYGGEATSNAEITGEAGSVISSPTYEGLLKMATMLDENKCPKNTKMITGSRYIDTRTISGSRFMFIGSELIPTLYKMRDLFGEKAFIEAHQYGAGGNIAGGGTTLAHGEIGSIGQWRFILVPDMLRWEGAGAVETADNAGYRATGGKYDVFPMLAVGSESFTNIGFQTDSKNIKWIINTVSPKENMSETQPYAKVGVWSIEWYYGSLIKRPDHIALYKVVAEM